ncbi:GMC family oxidoreductase [Amycolatopsis acidiphila]|uniref:Cholesterol oxidase n=1 Tax=Amycolatopsis acidiphila TaxID=715473 RepID=A0A558A6E8_9PSEU|nr:GMC family oxidoreductase [Amycolatopsis acidiphila]TVT19844.1 GMC family oxidoreductase [Amycolatopsis acidiphila]UIJ58752.1 GMC family oxidoreductase [Amycolatopsis acidiphila]GHG71727.1 cholesterol oxidase [Amycolatopsis acidiphila]
MGEFDYDVVVIGSGFGGSVAALRLTEKGYRVGVLEAGRRFADHEFAKNSWHLRDYLFAPGAGCTGIQRITLLRDVLVLTGAGVGGGSLVYANTLYEPPEAFYRDKQWGHITDWRDELAPFYDQAKRMLGVRGYPRVSPADRVLRAVAEDMGVRDTYHPTQVGVFFGDRPGEQEPDPFFGGLGPARSACTHCGECMTGCRHNAKNTLVKNYLYLAERAGATVHALTTVTDVRPLPGGGFAVHTKRTGGRAKGRFTAGQVVFSAAALGTQRLLHRLRDRGSLPAVSDRLGTLSRTNSEAVLAAKARGGDVDYSEGVSITSSMHPDAHTHVESVRYGHGSNLMGLLMTVLVDAQEGRARWRLGLRELARHRRDLRRLLNPRHWSERTIALLVMQSLDNSLTTYTRRGLFGRRMTTRQGIGEPNPVWIPAGHEATRRVADKIGGIAGGAWSDLANIPLTGHSIGGCAIGDSPATGVVDPYHRLYGYEGLHVVDGSTISANLGVNPALTITAQAERAMSLWPNKGEADRRPPQGAPYVRLEPVAPKNPVVPEAAPGALRLPVSPR